VQAFLKMPFSVKSLGVDMAAVSAHKVHAMKGAGAMYIKSSVRLKPFIHGGGQEGGYRSGTEAVPAIASFGAAAEKGKLCLEKTVAHASKINRYIRDQISERLPEAVFIGGGIDSILSFSIPGTKSEVIMNSLDLDGICVSNGSACMRGRKSHVLKSMGLPSDVIDGALRLSFSAENTLEEADYFVDRLCIAAGRFKK
jgi:cysteine desulfurase